MSVYTRTGDRGMTLLYGGQRVSKSSLWIEAYGSIDELSSFIGLTIIKLGKDRDRILLTSIQKDLYQIMACLSGAKVKLMRLNKKVKIFEQIIDKAGCHLSKLTRFILPQGKEISCWFHILRTICRRSERNVVALAHYKTFNFSLLTFNLIIQYLNRLSDLFFTLARKHNQQKEVLI